MRTRKHLLGHFIVALTFILGTARQPAVGQVRIPAEARSNQAQFEQVLRQGSRLEDEQRWGEALSLYEKASKRFPDRNDITARLTTALAPARSRSCCPTRPCP